MEQIYYQIQYCNVYHAIGYIFEKLLQFKNFQMEFQYWPSRRL